MWVRFSTPWHCLSVTRALAPQFCFFSKLFHIYFSLLIEKLKLRVKVQPKGIIKSCSQLKSFFKEFFLLIWERKGEERRKTSNPQEPEQGGRRPKEDLA